MFLKGGIVWELSRIKKKKANAYQQRQYGDLSSKHEALSSNPSTTKKEIFSFIDVYIYF
jgi:hypothetical protein